MKHKYYFILIIALILSSNTSAQEFYRGVDLSYVNELEASGVTYSNADGVEQDVYTILGNKGSNLVRLRLWHNPQWTNFSNLADVTKAIQRAKHQGMSVLLDFHYSDFWCDPGRQWRPEAWNNCANDSILGDSLYAYTYKTLKTLADQGLMPEMVQIGNETNGNICIKRTTQKIDASSPGLSPINWKRQVSLLHRGIAAVKQINTDYSDSVKTVIHVAQPEKGLWWFRDATAAGLVGYDIIGLSYYPQWSSMGLQETAETIGLFKETYQKDVMIVETGYPYRTWGNDGAGDILGPDSKLDVYNNVLSNEVQRDFLIELSYLIKENGGIGLIYWEPAWVSSNAKTYWATGSHYENCTLFDFDRKLNIGADYLSYDYSVIPQGLADKNITFQVNMSGQDTQNGVFVTGSFTGADWELIEMDNIKDDLYELSTTIPGRTEGGYIFYNNSVWDNSYRETVPSACANMWNTHRKYIIFEDNIEYSFNWNSCSTVAIESNKYDNNIVVYPSPAGQFIYISNDNSIQNIKVINTLGQNQNCEFIGDNCVDVSHLKTGQYIIMVSTSSKNYAQKFMKK